MNGVFVVSSIIASFVSVQANAMYFPDDVRYDDTYEFVYPVPESKSDCAKALNVHRVELEVGPGEVIMDINPYDQYLCETFFDLNLTKHELEGAIKYLNKASNAGETFQVGGGGWKDGYVKKAVHDIRDFGHSFALTLGVKRRTTVDRLIGQSVAHFVVLLDREGYDNVLPETISYLKKKLRGSLDY